MTLLDTLDLDECRSSNVSLIRAGWPSNKGSSYRKWHGFNARRDRLPRETNRNLGAKYP